MARVGTTGFGFSSGGFDAFNGYVSELSRQVKTDAYISSALDYTHAKLSQALDLWIDAQAKESPEEFQHVYEWPDTFHDYGQTVGNPTARLWVHVFNGRGKSRVATFQFLPSTKPSPVNPILEEETNGRAVKSGVHIFEWKAQAMEYGITIHVEPKLARFLAFVGTDGRIVFTDQPVEFRAGGDVSHMAFTTAFIAYWNGMAGRVFDQTIKPRLEGDLVDRTKIARLIKRGNMKSAKSMNIRAQATGRTADYNEAIEEARRDLREKERDYISEAAERRYAKYGI